MTPLDCALQRGYRSTAKFLQLHGGVPASRIGDQRQTVNSSLNLQIRDDVTFWGDTSTDSERENGEGAEKTDKKHYRKRFAHKLERKRLSLSGSDKDNGRVGSGRKESRAKRSSAKRSPSKLESPPSKRTSSRKVPSSRLDYTNEIIINGKTEINIHQTKEIIIDKEIGTQDEVEIVDKEVSIPPADKDRRPKSAKYKMRDKSARSSTEQEIHQKSLTPDSSLQKETRKGDLSLRDQSTNTSEETGETVVENNGLKKSVEEKDEVIEETAQKMIQSTLKQQHDQLSVISNTSDDVEAQKDLIVEAAVHEPPKLLEDISHQQSDTQLKNDQVVSEEREDTRKEVPYVAETAETVEGKVTEQQATEPPQESTIAIESQLDSQDHVVQEVAVKDVSKEELSNVTTKATEETSVDKLDTQVVTKDENAEKNGHDLEKVSEVELTRDNVSADEKKQIIDEKEPFAHGTIQTEGRIPDTMTDVLQKQEEETETKNHITKVTVDLQDQKQGPQKEKSSEKSFLETDKETVDLKVEIDPKSEVKERKIKKTTENGGKVEAKALKRKKWEEKNDVGRDKEQKRINEKLKEVQVVERRRGRKPLYRDGKSNEITESTSFSEDSLLSPEEEKLHKSFKVLDEAEALQLEKMKQKKGRLKRSPLRESRSKSEESKHTKFKKSKIPTPVFANNLSKSDKYLDRVHGDQKSDRLDVKVPSLPNIYDEKNRPIELRSESNMSAPVHTSIYSDIERDSASGGEQTRSTTKSKRKIKRKSRTRDSRSAGSDYESSNLIDSGFEPSPRSTRIPRWKNMTERGVNMTSVTQNIQNNIRRLVVTYIYSIPTYFRH